MIDPAANIAYLHSLRLRSRNYAAKRLLQPDREIAFLNSLKRALGENVYLISTGLGLDIYYLAETKKTGFILEHLHLFYRNSDQKRIKMLKMEERSGRDVLHFFDTAIEDLSQHPQLFLSCCKKMISEFKTFGLDSSLNKLLHQNFTAQLNRLSRDERLPHAGKIGKLQAREYVIIQEFIDRSQKLRGDFFIEKHDN